MVIAHNDTIKTGKNSQLFILDDNFNKIKIEEINGKSCHNIYKSQNRTIILNSLEGEILVNNESVCSNLGFVRGLAVSDDYILFGSSAMSVIREQRKKIGSIYITDKQFNTVGKVEIYSTQIYEIRRVDVIDHGMSCGRKIE